jgi:hypothetical protein
MARLKVDSIRNRNDDGAPSLIKGASIPSGANLTVNGDLNLTGVTTVGFITFQNATVGIVTASSFVGDGSGLTSLQVVTAAKAYALRSFLDPLPFRS